METDDSVPATIAIKMWNRIIVCVEKDPLKSTLSKCDYIQRLTGLFYSLCANTRIRGLGKCEGAYSGGKLIDP